MQNGIKLLFLKSELLFGYNFMLFNEIHHTSQKEALIHVRKTRTFFEKHFFSSRFFCSLVNNCLKSYVWPSSLCLRSFIHIFMSAQAIVRDKWKWDKRRGLLSKIYLILCYESIDIRYLITIRIIKALIYCSSGEKKDYERLECKPIGFY